MVKEFLKETPELWLEKMKRETEAVTEDEETGRQDQKETIRLTELSSLGELKRLRKRLREQLPISRPAERKRVVKVGSLLFSGMEEGHRTAGCAAAGRDGKDPQDGQGRVRNSSPQPLHQATTSPSQTALNILILLLSSFKLSNKQYH